MLYTIVIVLLVVIAGCVIYLATLDGSYNLRRTQKIDADINLVFDKIRDFKSWPDWSPWLIHEKDTKLVYSENCNDEGGFYSWNGKYVGAGKLTHIKFERSHHIEQKLEFTRPFKSVCEVGFEFSDSGGQTEISWYIRGKMPFLFRFMAQKTRDMLSKDYDLGLAMLNGQLVPNAEHPTLQFEGETTKDPVYSLCEGFSGDLQSMEKAMKRGFPKLIEYIVKQQEEISGAPFTAYHKSNIKTIEFICDMAVPVTETIDPGEYQLKTLGGGKFYKVIVGGDYEFLELAWYSAMAHVRMYKYKYDKSRASLEVYENDPEQVNSTNDLLTTLYIAIK